MHNDESLLAFSTDLKHSKQAVNVILDSLVNDMKALGTELESVVDIAREDAERAEQAGERSFSLQELRGQRTSIHFTSSGVPDFSKIDHRTGRTSMERFTINAGHSVGDAIKFANDIQGKYVSLLGYFGEDEQMASDDFFRVFNSFVAEFDKAQIQVEKDEKAKKKAAEKQRKAEEKAKKEEAKRKAKEQKDASNNVVAALAFTGVEAQKNEGSDSPESRRAGVMAAIAAKGVDSEEGMRSARAGVLAAIASRKDEKSVDTGATDLGDPRAGLMAAIAAKASATEGQEDRQKGNLQKDSRAGLMAAIASRADKTAIPKAQQDEAGSTAPRAGLMAAIASRANTTAKPKAQQDEAGSTDPRAGLMAAIASRANTTAKPKAQQDEAGSTDPRAGLMAAIASRANTTAKPKAQQDEAGSTDPRAGLMAAIASRANNTNKPKDEQNDTSSSDPRAGLMAAIASRGNTASKPNTAPHDKTHVGSRASLMAAIASRSQSDSEGTNPGNRDHPLRRTLTRYSSPSKVGEGGQVDLHSTPARSVMPRSASLSATSDLEAKKPVEGRRRLRSASAAGSHEQMLQEMKASPVVAQLRSVSALRAREAFSTPQKEKESESKMLKPYLRSVSAMRARDALDAKGVGKSPQKPKSLASKRYEAKMAEIRQEKDRASSGEGSATIVRKKKADIDDGGMAAVWLKAATSVKQSKPGTPRRASMPSGTSTATSGFLAGTPPLHKPRKLDPRRTTSYDFNNNRRLLSDVGDIVVDERSEMADDLPSDVGRQELAELRQILSQKPRKGAEQNSSSDKTLTSPSQVKVESPVGSHDLSGHISGNLHEKVDDPPIAASDGSLEDSTLDVSDDQSIRNSSQEVSNLLQNSDQKALLNDGTTENITRDNTISKTTQGIDDIEKPLNESPERTGDTTGLSSKDNPTASNPETEQRIESLPLPKDGSGESKPEVFSQPEEALVQDGKDVHENDKQPNSLSETHDMVSSATIREAESIPAASPTQNVDNRNESKSDEMAQDSSVSQDFSNTVNSGESENGIDQETSKPSMAEEQGSAIDTPPIAEHLASSTVDLLNDPLTVTKEEEKNDPKLSQEPSSTRIANGESTQTQSTTTTPPTASVDQEAKSIVGNDTNTSQEVAEEKEKTSESNTANAITPEAEIVDLPSEKPQNTANSVQSVETITPVSDQTLPTQQTTNGESATPLSDKMPSQSVGFTSEAANQKVSASEAKAVSIKANNTPNADPQIKSVTTTISATPIPQQKINAPKTSPAPKAAPKPPKKPTTQTARKPPPKAAPKKPITQTARKPPPVPPPNCDDDDDDDEVEV